MAESQTIVLSISVIVTILAAIFKAYKDDIKRVHERIDEVVKDFVDCKFCDRQHNDLNANIKEIKEQNSKILDAVLKR
jgi:low affinity Fe/Cu permease